MEVVLAYGPKTGPAFLRFFHCDIFGEGGVGGCNNVLFLRSHRSSSVNTLHATFDTSVLLRLARFMLRSTLLFYFGKHASCYVLHCCFTSVSTLHATFYTVLFFGKHASCYVLLFCCTSVSTLHAMFYSSVVLR